MSHKRVVRVISYEGIDSWVDQVLKQDALTNHRLHTIFTKQGTIKELQRVELGDGEALEISKKPAP